MSSSICLRRQGPTQWSLLTEKNFQSSFMIFRNKWNSCLPFHKILYWSKYLPEVMIKLVALTAWNTVAQHLVTICLLPRLPGSIISQTFDDTNFLRGMYSLTSRCFCSCLPCLPYSERARVRCLGLHSRNPAVEHFQERQWIQPPWNIALEIKFGLTIYNIHINIYSILYMVQFFFLGKNHPPDIPHHLIPLAVQCCLTPELFI